MRKKLGSILLCFRGSTTLLTPCFWAYSLQKCGTINFCSKPPSLWYFVIVTLGNLHIPSTKFFKIWFLASYLDLSLIVFLPQYVPTTFTSLLFSKHPKITSTLGLLCWLFHQPGMPFLHLCMTVFLFNLGLPSHEPVVIFFP